MRPRSKTDDGRSCVVRPRITTQLLHVESDTDDWCVIKEILHTMPPRENRVCRFTWDWSKKKKKNPWPCRTSLCTTLRNGVILLQRLQLYYRAKKRCCMSFRSFPVKNSTRSDSGQQRTGWSRDRVFFFDAAYCTWYGNPHVRWYENHSDDRIARSRHPFSRVDRGEYYHVMLVSSSRPNEGF